MRKRIWLPLAGVVIALGAGAAFAAFAWRSLHAPLPIAAEGAWLEVVSGMPLRRVSAELAARGLLEHPWLLDAYTRATGAATRIRAGEYRLETGVTPLALVDQLVAGQVFLHQLTVVEGWRFAELLAAVRVALRARLDEAWESRSANIEVDSPYEALILASIIEKETALPSERRLISGVFTERLRRNMRLQTDPTVIYGLGESYDGNLRRQDLDRDTPYNTYTRAGLPPTPIALPGNASLTAAVDPEITDAVFFVATGRGDGSHYFSATLEQHEQAVREYLKQLRNPEP
jgi:UPF0755 protein